MATSSFFNAVHLTTVEQVEKMLDAIEESKSSHEAETKLRVPVVELTGDELKKAFACYEDD